MFLLVPAYPGCPGSKAVKRSLLLLLLLLNRPTGQNLIKVIAKTSGVSFFSGQCRKCIFLSVLGAVQSIREVCRQDQ